MSIEEIEALQAEHGLTQMQTLITSGDVWKFEGSMGRAAMENLKSGACFLPIAATIDYYGNRIPSRNELKEGTKGTLKNSETFWEAVTSGEINLD